MTKSPEKRQSQSDRRRSRAEIIDWLPAVGAVVLLGLIAELGLFGSDGSWKLFWALLNLIPALWIVRAVVRSLRRADEYQCRGQLEALAIGFGVVMLAIYTAGILEVAGVGNLEQSVQISFIAGMLSWLAVLLFKTRRAR